MAKIEEKVEQLVKDPIEKLGYSLYDVEYVKEGPEYYLRIYIDKESGIDLNDCEKVSNEINEILDKADYIKEQYYLEVSSPGIERKLRKDKHLEQNISKNVEIKLFKKDNNGKKEYTGKLKAFNQEEIIIETDKEIAIERKNIAQIKTIYEW
ncbi:MAG TPA: ribosome maturation factor RimP [Clostridiales bacterium]|jgi:ribosome maturation factor rimP|nr:ribosome maturation factor RimP [Clostridia bacterium]HCQ55421.1 ribosome maturation factor RimP [Clostridiales bacterium]